jgi:Mg/Co/Ni transporter MgtE
MAEPEPKSTAAPSNPPWWKRAALKIATLVVAGLLLGWAYDWAAPRFYRPEHVAGFMLGVVHGALMPVALPSLLLGSDVPIYTSNNTGRTYKIGYIAGINLCGLFFFGLAFRQPRPR